MFGCLPPAVWERRVYGHLGYRWYKKPVAKCDSRTLCVGHRVSWKTRVMRGVPRYSFAFGFSNQKGMDLVAWSKGVFLDVFSIVKPITV